jgi:hypothetical protein
MPKPPPRPCQVVLRLSEDELGKVDQLADALIVNRSEAIRVMIDSYRVAAVKPPTRARRVPSAG